MVRINLPRVALTRVSDELFKAMMKDEETFHDPLQFLPERHLENLKKGKKMDTDSECELLVYIDPNDLVSGFGRR